VEREKGVTELDDPEYDDEQKCDGQCRLDERLAPLFPSLLHHINRLPRSPNDEPTLRSDPRTPSGAEVPQ